MKGLPRVVTREEVYRARSEGTVLLGRRGKRSNVRTGRVACIYMT